MGNKAKSQPTRPRSVSPRCLCLAPLSVRRRPRLTPYPLGGDVFLVTIYDSTGAFVFGPRRPRESSSAGSSIRRSSTGRRKILLPVILCCRSPEEKKTLAMLLLACLRISTLLLIGSKFIPTYCFNLSRFMHAHLVFLSGIASLRVCLVRGRTLPA